MPFKDGLPELYSVWRGIINRCYNPKSKQFKDYGGRGISVCDIWRHDYKQFIKDMSPRPSGLTLDRIDNDKGYTLDNCRWSTRKEQQRNQRRTHRVIIEGLEYLACELAETHGLKMETILDRAKKGLTFQQVTSKEIFRNLEGLKLGAVISSTKRLQRTHCKNGHEYTQRNTRIDSDGKYSFRVCRKCHSERQLRKP